MSITERLFDKLGDRLVRQAELSRAELQAGLTETRDALRITGARNRPIYANTVAWAGSGRLVGWSIEAGAGGCTVRVHDGRSADAELLAAVQVDAGKTVNGALPGAGVSFGEACFVAVVGTLAGGTIYLGVRD